MILNELFGNATEWTEEVCSKSDHIYVFKINGNPFEALFEEIDDNVWAFMFSRSDRILSNPTAITGDGDQFQVFATIKDILSNFLEHVYTKLSDDSKKQFQIEFTADKKEPSRVRLYSRMIKQVSTLYPDLKGTQNGSFFYITSNTNEDPTKVDMRSRMANMNIPF